LSLNDVKGLLKWLTMLSHVDTCMSTSACWNTCDNIVCYISKSLTLFGHGD